MTRRTAYSHALSAGGCASDRVESYRRGRQASKYMTSPSTPPAAAAGPARGSGASSQGRRARGAWTEPRGTSLQGRWRCSGATPSHAAHACRGARRSYLQCPGTGCPLTSSVAASPPAPVAPPASSGSGAPPESTAAKVTTADVARARARARSPGAESLARLASATCEESAGCCWRGASDGRGAAVGATPLGAGAALWRRRGGVGCTRAMRSVSVATQARTRLPSMRARPRRCGLPASRAESTDREDPRWPTSRPRTPSLWGPRSL